MGKTYTPIYFHPSTSKEYAKNFDQIFKKKKSKQATEASKSNTSNGEGSSNGSKDQEKRDT